MVNAIKTHAMARFSLAFADSSSFAQRSLERLIDLDQITEESLNNRFEIDGAAVDQAIDLGNINSPTIVVVIASSKFDGENGTKEDDPAKIQFKIGGGTIFEAHFMAFLVDVDANTGKVTTDIQITTLADSDTIVEVFVAGAKT